MKSHIFNILLSILLITFTFAGCTPSIQQKNNNTTQNVATEKKYEDERDGLQRYMELVTEANTSKAQYETSKPEGYVRFSWVPNESPELNFAEGKDYALYALVDPNDHNLQDYNATQVFYLEIVDNDQHIYYGPFETKHLDFTQ